MNLGMVESAAGWEISYGISHSCQFIGEYLFFRHVAEQTEQNAFRLVYYHYRSFNV